MTITYQPANYFPHTGLNFMVQSQAGKEITFNDVCLNLDAMVNCGVQNQTTNTPPSSPNNGDMYIVGSSPTGAWAGQALNIAYWVGAGIYAAGWNFIYPYPGSTMFDISAGGLFYWSGTSWNELGDGSGALTVANNLSDVANAVTAFKNICPMTTKGDLLGFNGTNNVRYGVGTDGYVLTADSTNAHGWDWQLPTQYNGPYHNVVAAFGAVGDNTTDNTTSLTNAFAAIAADGGTLFFPAGLYMVASQITQEFSYSSEYALTRPSILGNGSGISQITWGGSSAPTGNIITLNSNNGGGVNNEAHCQIAGIGFAPQSATQNQYINGLLLENFSYISVNDVQAYGLNAGISATNLQGYNFQNVQTRANNFGMIFKNCNVPLLLNCSASANLIGGIECNNSPIKMIGGSVSNNGTSATAGTAYGIYQHGLTSANASCMSLEHVAVQGNGSTGVEGTNSAVADIWIKHDPDTTYSSRTYSVRDCNFQRNSGNYAPYGIYVDMDSATQAILDINSGNQFQSGAGYTPNALNPVIYFNNSGGGLGHITLLGNPSGNGYANSIEAPDYAQHNAYYTGLGGGYNCLISGNSGQTINSSSGVPLSWNSTTYNDAGMSNLGASPTKIFAPAHASKMRFECNVRFGLTSAPNDYFSVFIYKNGVPFTGMGYATIATSSVSVKYSIDCQTADIPVAGGTDYFEVWAAYNGGSVAIDTTIPQATWFSATILA